MVDMAIDVGNPFVLLDSTGSEADEKEVKERYPILDFASDYLVNGKYSDGLPKERKRAVRKWAATLELDKGQVFWRGRDGEWKS